MYACYFGGGQKPNLANPEPMQGLSLTMIARLNMTHRTLLAQEEGLGFRVALQIYGSFPKERGPNIDPTIL